MRQRRDIRYGTPITMLMGLRWVIIPMRLCRKGLGRGGRRCCISILPTPQPDPTPQPTITYRIQPGDTLGGIAARYGTTVPALAQLNGITNPNRIYAGQVIRIPVGSTHPVEPAYYVVRRGDTLGGIARRFGTTYQKLAQLNGIRNPNLIYVGQRLRIH